MKGLKDLAGKFNEETLRQKTVLCEKWIEKFYNFVVSRVDNPEIKKRIRYVYENLTIYTATQGKTMLPSYYNGRNDSFTMNKPGLFFQENCETRIGEDNHSYTYVTPAVAIDSSLSQPATFLHETAHAFAYAMKYLDEEGGFYKGGLRIYQIHNDCFQSKSGNLLDEGMTEAITKLFLQENFEELSQDFPQMKSAEPKGAYNSTNVLYEMLDGGNNTLLIAAYFGGVEEYRAFEKHFDEVMADQGITFKELNMYRWEVEANDSEKMEKLNYYAKIYKERYKQFSMQEDIEMDM